MRKQLLTLFIAIASTVSFGQNVDKQDVSFKYIQWPSHPVDESIITYKVVNDPTAYEQVNQDSLALYQSRLELLDVEFTTWLESKRSMDRMHLQKMSAWEKNRKTNPTLKEPKREAYPPIPLKEEFPKPILTEEVSSDVVNRYFKMDGFQQTEDEDGITITISVLGFMDAGYEERSKTTNGVTKKSFGSICKLPIYVKVEIPGETIMEETVGDQLSYSGLRAADKYALDLWRLDNEDAHWKKRQKDLLVANLKRINEMINDKIGFTEKTRKTSMFIVKKFKDHDYTDLIDGYTAVKQGYDLLYKDKNKEEAIEKIQGGIEIWEEAFKESNLTDSKVRVNKKVSAMLQANLAEAYLWIDDYAKAENYLQKTKVAGVAKYKRFAKRLQALLNEQSQRYSANH